MANAYAELVELLVYRNLLQDDLVKKMINSDDGKVNWELAGELIIKAEELGLTGNLPNSYMIHLIGKGKNIFSSTAEKNGGKVGASLVSAVTHDVAILKRVFKQHEGKGANRVLCDYKPTHQSADEDFVLLQDYLTDSTRTSEQVAALLCDYYARYGYGEMANYKAFRWDRARGMVGVKHVDRIRLEDIVGYERQKNTLARNTEAFIAGKAANNILLVGARGTGKSSSVKALANRYYKDGLRLLEVAKNDLDCLPSILSATRNWGKKFILFLDDLSFEESELGYKQLKSVMDGGLEAKPENVLIYATSNRRHLIRESWSDRGGDEVHQQDTINEKISLSDRFGITLTYTSPNQDEYLKIVEDIARKNDVNLATTELRTQALRWEIAHSGRSGRLAKQFVDDLVSKASCS